MDGLPDYARSRAILIQTSTYRDSRYPPLPAAANSLHAMHDVLINPKLCSWPKDRVEKFENPADHRKLVTKLNSFARETEDVLLLYVVGHGSLTKDGQLVIILKETNQEYPDIAGLEYRWIRNALLDSPAKTKIVILDCCYSGRAIQALSSAESSIADTASIEGAYTLTASDTTARVPPLKDQFEMTTSFTGVLLNVIRDGIPGGPEYLTLNQIYPHLLNGLLRKGLPLPNQRGTGTSAQFQLTRNSAFQITLSDPDHATPIADHEASPTAASKETASRDVVEDVPAAEDPKGVPRESPPQDKPKAADVDSITIHARRIPPPIVAAHQPSLPIRSNPQPTLHGRLLRLFLCTIAAALGAALFVPIFIGWNVGITTASGNTPDTEYIQMQCADDDNGCSSTDEPINNWILNGRRSISTTFDDQSGWIYLNPNDSGRSLMGSLGVDTGRCPSASVSWTILAGRSRVATGVLSSSHNSDNLSQPIPNGSRSLTVTFRRLDNYACSVPLKWANAQLSNQGYGARVVTLLTAGND